MYAGWSERLRDGEAASVFRRVGVFAADEGPDAGESHDREHDAERGADIAEALARGFAGSDAPLGGEEPDAVREVPADGDHGDDVDGEHPGIRQLMLHLGEGRVGIFGQADAHEALAKDVLDDVSEGDEAGVALGHVHPVAGPGVVDDVGLAAQPDVDAVDAVIEDGQEDEDPLEHADQRQAVEELDLRAVGDGAFERFEVREQVLEQKSADGNDAEQRMQLAPEEGVSLAGAQRLNARCRVGAEDVEQLPCELRLLGGCGSRLSALSRRGLNRRVPIALFDSGVQSVKAEGFGIGTGSISIQLSDDEKG